MKVVEIKKNVETSPTLGEAMQSIMDNLGEQTRDTPVNNIVVISQTNSEYQFAFLNTTNLRSMLGTMDCVKSYVIEILNDYSNYSVDGK